MLFMAKITCPHCEKTFDAPFTPFSAHVEHLEHSTDIFPRGAYHPDPTKQYRTSEHTRRIGLAYYWKNRDRVLAKAKERRRASGAKERWKPLDPESK
jgi:hypothetical protein